MVKSIQEQLPRRPACRTGRGNIIVEYTTNKEKALELPILINVAIVSSSANSRQLLWSEKSFGIYIVGKKSRGEQGAERWRLGEI
jgi:hypothetical protein